MARDAMARDALGDLEAWEAFALGGLLAVLLGRRAAHWGDELSARLLRQLTVGMLQLREDQCEALRPLMEPVQGGQGAPDLSAFAAAVPARADTRLAIVKELLVMTVTGVGCQYDAKLIGYDARARQLLCDLARELEVPWALVAAHERAIAIEMKTIQQQLMHGKSESSKQEKKQDDRAVWKRRLVIAGVGVVSGAVIGVTGGLAAPAVVGGIAAVGGGISSFGGAAVFIGASVTGAATLLSGAGGVAIVSAIFGATGAGLAARKMEKRLKDVSQFEFSQPDPKALTDEVLAITASDTNPALLISICASGWLSNPPDWHARHWFGAAAAEERHEEQEKGLLSRATDTVKGSVTGFVQNAYSWSSQGLKAAATRAAPSASDGDECKTSTRQLNQNADWLVETGFPEDKVRQYVDQAEANGSDPSMEQMIESLVELSTEERQDVAPALESSSIGASNDAPRAESSHSNANLKQEASTAKSSTDLWAHAKNVTQNLTPWGQTQAKASDGKAGCGILECLPHVEHHTLVWESKELRALGEALANIAAAEAIGYLKGQVIKQTFFSALASSYALPALLMKVCDILDQPWAVAYDRSVKAGHLLADILIHREQGARPVVLIGFGLGANLIFECLLHMVRKLEEGNEAAEGVVQHAVFMGIPTSADPSRWERLKRVVAGRVVNCYRPDDLVLSLVHRASNLAFDVAGLAPVNTEVVENIDVSKIITSHHRYRHHIKDVLNLVKLEGTEGESNFAFDRESHAVVEGMQEAVDTMHTLESEPQA